MSIADSCMSVAESDATFTSATKDKIRQYYRHRCAICLLEVTNQGSECAHMFDKAGAGAQQVATAVGLEILLPSYRCSASTNAMVRCPTCHLAFFTYNYIVLSPALPILQYLATYVSETDVAKQMPLHKVISLLFGPPEGHIDLPDPTPILPYLGLYTLVILKPDELCRLQLITPHLPGLSILQGADFVSAPPDTSPNAPNTARIFDVMHAPPNGPDDILGRIPLSNIYPSFTEKRYWRIPVRFEVILSMFLQRVSHITITDSEEIRSAQIIRSTILLRKMKTKAPDVAISRSGQSDPVGASQQTGDCPSNGEMSTTKDDVDASAFDGDQPHQWTFGPSYTTNDIIHTAMARVLV